MKQFFVFWVKVHEGGLESHTSGFLHMAELQRLTGTLMRLGSVQWVGVHDVLEGTITVIKQDFEQVK